MLKIVTGPTPAYREPRDIPGEKNTKNAAARPTAYDLMRAEDEKRTKAVSNANYLRREQ
jgi:hypothetical protein